jgi:hypothetical protein
MARISHLANNWPSLAPEAARLEQYQRASGFSPLLTAAELRQLCLLMQRYAAVVLADKADQEQAGQQALALRRTALAASRQLCKLQPGSAAYLLHLAKDTAAAEVEGGTAMKRNLKATRTAMQAAIAEKGAAAAENQLSLCCITLALHCTGTDGTD